MYLKYVIALYINVLIAVFLVKTKALKKNLIFSSINDRIKICLKVNETDNMGTKYK